MTCFKRSCRVVFCAFQENNDHSNGKPVGKNALASSAVNDGDVRSNNGRSPRQHRTRLKSTCLLDPGSAAIPSLMDLTEQDYDVNAPAAGALLQGSDLLRALDIGNIAVS